jgi:hypothetical protein
MAHRRREKMGCCELAVVVFALFVALQFAAFGARVVTELVELAAVLVKWVGLGLAGALSILALSAAVFGVSWGVSRIARGIFGRAPAARTDRAPSATHHQQARKWQRGIATTVGQLQKRGWLKKEDARRYRESVDAAVERIRCLEQDLRTLRSLPASEGLADDLEEAARTLVARLEQTHRAVARLLAESSLHRAPSVDAKLREAADELESLVAALEEVNGSTVSSAAESVASGKTTEQRRASEALTDEVLE